MYKNIKNLEGTYNFRDLGGFEGLGGKRITKGRLFRSDDLSDLTDNDLEILQNIPVITNIDFRDEREKNINPNKFPKSLERNVELPIAVGRLIENEMNMEGFDPYVAMQKANHLFVTDFQPQYAKFFEILSNSNDPLIFHCSAGKDRTGYAAALVQLALGVKHEVVFEQYMLSKELVEPKYRDIVAKDNGVYPMYTVEREYLEEAVKTIYYEYGGVESYLTKQLRVDLPHFRNKFLE